MNRGKKILLWLAIPLVGVLHLHGQDQTKAQPGNRELWITVFVHGIMGVKPYLTGGNVSSFFADRISDTTYAKAVEIMRADPFFFQNQAMQERGLVRIDENEKHGNAAGAFALIMDRMEQLAGLNNKNHYYTYGWSGLLSASSRYQEAIRFLSDLTKLMTEYQKKGLSPKLRVVGYSHGGSVCLSLAAARQEMDPNSALEIDELVLVGMPVQRETEGLVTDHLFKRVYNLYSLRDRVQRIDIINQERVLPDRTFQPRKGFKLPTNLLQVELKLTRPRKGVDPGSAEFEHAGDLTDRRIVRGSHPLLRDASAGHGELWFFGWTPRFYRKSFPINPLPMIAVLPFIQAHLKALEGGESPLRSMIVADVRPAHGVMLFKRRSIRETELIKTVDFPQLDEIKKMSAKLSPFIPQNYTKARYDERSTLAEKEAREQLVEEKKHRRASRKAHKRLSCDKRRQRAKKSSIPNC